MSRQAIGGAFEGPEATESGWKDTGDRLRRGQRQLRQELTSRPCCRCWRCPRGVLADAEDNRDDGPFFVNNADGTQGPGCTRL